MLAQERVASWPRTVVSASVRSAVFDCARPRVAARGLPGQTLSGLGSNYRRRKGMVAGHIDAIIEDDSADAGS
jgi:hypothetical protein